MGRKGLSALLLVTVLTVGLAAGCTSGENNGQSLSGGAPDFLLPSVDGSMVRLSDHSGKVIIVDFWATWCPPCEEMIPVLSKLHREFSEKGLVVLGVAMDREGLGVLGTFVHEKMIPYKVLMGDDKVTRSFGGVSSIPTLFIIDREGRLVRKLMGYHTFGQLKDQISRYLEQPAES
ncbi:MAG: TlpA disulfide reductase family protein [bacterium]|nr:TlpA disulfide reductase family protein [bacterium]